MNFLNHKLNNKNKDPYIIGYRYLRQRLYEGKKTGITGFTKFMQSEGVKDEDLIKAIFLSAVIPGYNTGDKKGYHLLYNGYGERKKDFKFDIEAEPYFNLFDVEELIEARKASQEARIWSLIAIVISVLSIMVSVMLSFRTQSVNIENTEEFHYPNQVLDE